MTSSMWIPYFVIFIILFVVIPRRKRIRAALVSRKYRDRSDVLTGDSVDRFVGKRCYIHTLDGAATVQGMITEKNGSWISVIPDGSDSAEIINGAYISLIQECPEKHKERKKKHE